MRSRWGALTCIVGLGCVPFAPNLKDLPCDESGGCATGYICDTSKNICVRPEELDTQPPDEECIPQGEELCDGVDNDCNGAVDDVAPMVLKTQCDAVHASAHVAAWQCIEAACVTGICETDFYDIDGAPGCEYACELGTSSPIDCFPDDDCDGIPDNGTSVSCVNYYRDDDRDGYGTAADFRCVCGAEFPYDSLRGDDCDDTQSAIHPDAPEICDGIDNNCVSSWDESLGASCGCADGAPALSEEICGNGVDDNCNQVVDESTCALDWWNCDYSHRQPVFITTSGASLFGGYSVRVEFDHASLVSSGQSRADGADLRVVHWNGAQHIELHRVRDPATQWNTATTAIWFALTSPIGASTTDASYALYYGAAAPPAALEDEQAVFDFADFFDRPNAEDVGNGWSVVEGTADIDIKNGQLHVAQAADEVHLPWASHSFGPYIGTVELRLGFDWKRVGDIDYRIYMQLGFNPGAPPATGDLTSSNGIGPNILSASAADWLLDEDPNNPLSHEGLGYAVGSSRRQVDVVSGPAHITAIADPVTDSFDLEIDAGGTQRVYSDLAFGSALTSFNTVRFMAHKLDSTTFGPQRGFDYVWVRRYVDPAPTAVVSAASPSRCP